MRQIVSILLFSIIVSLLSGCETTDTLSFKPVAKLDQEKYEKDKNFYRSGVLEKLDQPKGYFWVFKKKF